MKNSLVGSLALCFLLSGCCHVHRSSILRASGQVDTVLAHETGVIGELVIGREYMLLRDFIEKIEQGKTQLQGGCVAILNKGQVIYKTVFGHKEGAAHDVTQTTLFSVASVSKLTTATAIALQVNAGMLDIEKEYTLPWLKHPVSLRHLLSHTAGYNFSEGNELIESGMSRQDILAVLAKTDPVATPGCSYAYSNIIFGLIDDLLICQKTSLRDCIERLSAVLKTDGICLAPLPANADISYPHRAGLDGKDAEILPLAPYYPYAAPAAAGIYASLDGLIELFKLRFGYRPDLIAPNIIDQFNKKVTRAPDFKKWNKHWPIPKRFIRSYYGLGCRILRSVKHRRKDLIYHTGFLNGMGAFIGFIPAEEMGIIIVLNQNSPFVFETGLDFWGLFLKH